MEEATDTSHVYWEMGETAIWQLEDHSTVGMDHQHSDIDLEEGIYLPKEHELGRGPDVCDVNEALGPFEV